MNSCTPIRALLYMSLLPCSIVLLGLTAYRVHYTKTLSGGDILTSRSNFYDPIIVELIVTSCLAILFSLWLFSTLLAQMKGPMGRFMTEHALLFILWVMFLVGAAVMTSDWTRLRWCRGFKVCRILETIKAFSWICWILTTFLIIASLVHMSTSRSHPSSGMYGEERERTSHPHPEVRQANTNPGTTTTYVSNINRTAEA